MTTATPRLKITYATLSADNAELQESFDRAVEWARGQLGQSYPMLIGAEERTHPETFEHRSPIDTDLVVSRFPVGTRDDVRDAVAAARAEHDTEDAGALDQADRPGRMDRLRHRVTGSIPLPDHADHRSGDVGGRA